MTNNKQNNSKKSTKKAVKRSIGGAGFSGTDGFINREALKEAHAFKGWGQR